jgi:hypothetical protein
VEKSKPEEIGLCVGSGALLISAALIAKNDVTLVWILHESHAGKKNFGGG